MARKKRKISTTTQLIIGPMLFGLSCVVMYWALFIMKDESSGQAVDPNDPFGCPLGYNTDGSIPETVPCDDLYEEQQYTKAIMCYRREVAEHEEHHGLVDIRTVASMVGVANVLEQMDTLDEALEMYQRVLGIRLKAFYGKGRLVSLSQQAVASVLMKLGRIGDAHSFWEDALLALDGIDDLSEDANVEMVSNKLDILDNIGLTNYYLGNSEEAHAAWAKSLPFAKQILGGKNVRLGKIYSQLGGASNKLQRYEIAAQHYESAIAIFTATLGEEHILVASAEADKGTTLYYAGDIEGSKQAMSTSLSIMEFIGMESSQEYKLVKKNMEQQGFF